MKKALFTMVAMAVGVLSAHAIDDTTVEIAYSGTTATVTVASNISSYVTVNSGTSSHVQLTQSSSFDPTAFKTTTNTTGEITYILSGSTTDGEFYLTAPSKCTIQLAGLTLTNAMQVYSGAAISVYGGKRIKLSAKNETTNTLQDYVSGTQDACVYVKGHLELQGKGTLTVYGNYKHAIKSTEYMSVKNLTLNIPTAVKDGMHCDEYFLMESGTVTLENIGSDGIEVDIDSSSTQTAELTDHDGENSGNFYQEDGTLTISATELISVGGTEYHRGGTYNGTSYSGISTISGDAATTTTADGIYDLNGRRVSTPTKGLYLIHSNGKTTKAIIK